MSPVHRWLVICGVGVMLAAAGCNNALMATEVPEGTIRVRYVRAADYTDCLVASAVMCANYVDEYPRLEPSAMRADMEAAGLDRTRVGDVRKWLKTQGFRMIPLKGRLADAPPDGLVWWVQERGYPVICVVNRHGGDPEYNHAVVVIGFDLDDNRTGVQAAHVLDPASPKGVEQWERARLEEYWGKTDQAMILVFRDPEPYAEAARGQEVAR